MTTLPIVDGPNRDRLIDAFKYAYDQAATVVVSFTVLARSVNGLLIMEEIKNATITAIQYNNSSECFIVFGFMPNTYNVGVPNLRLQFKAFYNTKDRKGTITF